MKSQRTWYIAPHWESRSYVERDTDSLPLRSAVVCGFFGPTPYWFYFRFRRDDKRDLNPRSNLAGGWWMPADLSKCRKKSPLLDIFSICHFFLNQAQLEYNSQQVKFQSWMPEALWILKIEKCFFVFKTIEFRRNPCLGLYLQEPKARVRLSFVVKNKKDLCYIRIFTGTREEEEGGSFLCFRVSWSRWVSLGTHTLGGSGNANQEAWLSRALNRQQSHERRAGDRIIVLLMSGLDEWSVYRYHSPKRISFSVLVIQWDRKESARTQVGCGVKIPVVNLFS